VIHLGIDLGPQALYAVAFSAEDGQVLARARRNYGLQQHDAIVHELDADALLNELSLALREVQQQLGQLTARIANLAVVGDGASCLFVDADNQAIAPIILSQDRRASKEARQLAALLAEESVNAPPFAEHQVANLMWLQANQPLQAEQVHRVIAAEELILLHLQGLPIGTVDSAAPVEFEPSTATPLAALLASLPRAGLGLMPRTRAKPTGPISMGLAQAFGFPKDLTIAFAGSRHEALAAAHRITDDGHLLLHIEDDAQLIAASAQGLNDAPRHWQAQPFEAANCCLFTRRLSALGLALDWYLSTLCDGEQIAAQVRGCRSEEIVAEAASTAELGSGGLSFSFRPTSDQNSHAWTAHWLGVQPGTTKRELSRAVFEGLGFALASQLDDDPRSPVEPRQITIAGRHSKHPAWCDILAHVFGCEVRRTSSHDGAAFGAALLAATLGQAAPALTALCTAYVHPISKSAPNSIDHARYDGLRARQRRLQQALACSEGEEH
jgi:xylulokinase